MLARGPLAYDSKLKCFFLKDQIRLTKIGLGVARVDTASTLATPWPILVLLLEVLYTE